MRAHHQTPTGVWIADCELQSAALRRSSSLTAPVGVWLSGSQSYTGHRKPPSRQLIPQIPYKCLYPAVVKKSVKKFTDRNFDPNQHGNLLSYCQFTSHTSGAPVEWRHSKIWWWWWWWSKCFITIRRQLFKLYCLQTDRHTNERKT